MDKKKPKQFQLDFVCKLEVGVVAPLDKLMGIAYRLVNWVGRPGPEE